MPKNQISLQDKFLNTLRVNKSPVCVFLSNGIRLQGRIEAFDTHVVFLKEKVTQMVYKHAILSVLPESQVDVTHAD